MSVAAPTASEAASALPITTPSSATTPNYRGATVEDLDLPPALSIPPHTPISHARTLCYERDYSQLTVTSDTRSLLGYVSSSSLNAPSLSGDEPVSKVMHRFDRRKQKGYKLITPDTPLEELEEFLRDEQFAVVTDERRRFVLALATREDLEGFLKRRPA